MVGGKAPDSVHILHSRGDTNNADGDVNRPNAHRTATSTTIAARGDASPPPPSSGAPTVAPTTSRPPSPDEITIVMPRAAPLRVKAHRAPQPAKGGPLWFGRDERPRSGNKDGTESRNPALIQPSSSPRHSSASRNRLFNAERVTTTPYRGRSFAQDSRRRATVSSPSPVEARPPPGSASNMYIDLSSLQHTLNEEREEGRSAGAVALPSQSLLPANPETPAVAPASRYTQHQQQHPALLRGQPRSPSTGAFSTTSPAQPWHPSPIVRSLDIPSMQHHRHTGLMISTDSSAADTVHTALPPSADAGDGQRTKRTEIYRSSAHVSEMYPNATPPLHTPLLTDISSTESVSSPESDTGTRAGSGAQGMQMHREGGNQRQEESNEEGEAEVVVVVAPPFWTQAQRQQVQPTQRRSTEPRHASAHRVSEKATSKNTDQWPAVGMVEVSHSTPAGEGAQQPSMPVESSQNAASNGSGIQPTKEGSTHVSRVTRNTSNIGARRRRLLLSRAPASTTALSPPIPPAPTHSDAATDSPDEVPSGTSAAAVNTTVAAAMIVEPKIDRETALHSSRRRFEAIDRQSLSLHHDHQSSSAAATATVHPASRLPTQTATGSSTSRPSSTHRPPSTLNSFSTLDNSLSRAEGDDDATMTINTTSTSPQLPQLSTLGDGEESEVARAEDTQSVITNTNSVTGQRNSRAHARPPSSIEDALHAHPLQPPPTTMAPMSLSASYPVYDAALQLDSALGSAVIAAAVVDDQTVLRSGTGLTSAVASSGTSLEAAPRVILGESAAVAFTTPSALLVTPSSVPTSTLVDSTSSRTPAVQSREGPGAGPSPFPRSIPLAPTSPIHFTQLHSRPQEIAASSSGGDTSVSRGAATKTMRRVPVLCGTTITSTSVPTAAEAPPDSSASSSVGKPYDAWHLRAATSSPQIVPEASQEFFVRAGPRGGDAGAQPPPTTTSLFSPDRDTTTEEEEGRKTEKRGEHEWQYGPKTATSPASTVQATDSSDTPPQNSKESGKRRRGKMQQPPPPAQQRPARRQRDVEVEVNSEPQDSVRRREQSLDEMLTIRSTVNGELQWLVPSLLLDGLPNMSTTDPVSSRADLSIQEPIKKKGEERNKGVDSASLVMTADTVVADVSVPLEVRRDQQNDREENSATEPERSSASPTRVSSAVVQSKEMSVPRDQLRQARNGGGGGGRRTQLRKSLAKRNPKSVRALPSGDLSIVAAAASSSARTRPPARRAPSHLQLLSDRHAPTQDGKDESKLEDSASLSPVSSSPCAGTGVPMMTMSTFAAHHSSAPMRAEQAISGALPLRPPVLPVRDGTPSEASPTRATSAQASAVPLRLLVQLLSSPSAVSVIPASMGTSTEAVMPLLLAPAPLPLQWPSMAASPGTNTSLVAAQLLEGAAQREGRIRTVAERSRTMPPVSMELKSEKEDSMPSNQAPSPADHVVAMASVEMANPSAAQFSPSTATVEPAAASAEKEVTRAEEAVAPRPRHAVLRMRTNAKKKGGAPRRQQQQQMVSRRRVVPPPPPPPVQPQYSEWTMETEDKTPPAPSSSSSFSSAPSPALLTYQSSPSPTKHAPTRAESGGDVNEEKREEEAEEDNTAADVERAIATDGTESLQGNENLEEQMHSPLHSDRSIEEAAQEPLLNAMPPRHHPSLQKLPKASSSPIKDGTGRPRRSSKLPRGAPRTEETPVPMALPASAVPRPTRHTVAAMTAEDGKTNLCAPQHHHRPVAQRASSVVRSQLHQDGECGSDAVRLTSSRVEELPSNPSFSPEASPLATESTDAAPNTLEAVPASAADRAAPPRHFTVRATATAHPSSSLPQPTPAAVPIDSRSTDAAALRDLPRPFGVAASPYSRAPTYNRARAPMAVRSAEEEEEKKEGFLSHLDRGRLANTATVAHQTAFASPSHPEKREEKPVSRNPYPLSHGDDQDTTERQQPLARTPRRQQERAADVAYTPSVIAVPAEAVASAVSSPERTGLQEAMAAWSPVLLGYTQRSPQRTFSMEEEEKEEEEEHEGAESAEVPPLKSREKEKVTRRRFFTPGQGKLPRHRLTKAAWAQPQLIVEGVKEAVIEVALCPPAVHQSREGSVVQGDEVGIEVGSGEGYKLADATQHVIRMVSPESAVLYASPSPVRGSRQASPTAAANSLAHQNGDMKGSQPYVEELQRPLRMHVEDFPSPPPPPQPRPSTHPVAHHSRPPQLDTQGSPNSSAAVNHSAEVPPGDTSVRLSPLDSEPSPAPVDVLVVEVGESAKVPRAAERVTGTASAPQPLPYPAVPVLSEVLFRQRRPPPPPPPPVPAPALRGANPPTKVSAPSAYPAVHPIEHNAATAPPANRGTVVLDQLPAVLPVAAVAVRTSPPTTTETTTTPAQTAGMVVQELVPGSQHTSPSSSNTAASLRISPLRAGQAGRRSALPRSLPAVGLTPDPPRTTVGLTPMPRPHSSDPSGRASTGVYRSLRMKGNVEERDQGRGGIVAAAAPVAGGQLSGRTLLSQPRPSETLRSAAPLWYPTWKYQGPNTTVVPTPGPAVVSATPQTSPPSPTPAAAAAFGRSHRAHGASLFPTIPTAAATAQRGLIYRRGGDLLFAVEPSPVMQEGTEGYGVLRPSPLTAATTMSSPASLPDGLQVPSPPPVMVRAPFAYPTATTPSAAAVVALSATEEVGRTLWGSSAAAGQSLHRHGQSRATASSAWTVANGQDTYYGAYQRSLRECGSKTVGRSKSGLSHSSARPSPPTQSYCTGAVSRGMVEGAGRLPSPMNGTAPQQQLSQPFMVPSSPPPPPPPRLTRAILDKLQRTRQDTRSRRRAPGAYPATGVEGGALLLQAGRAPQLTAPSNGEGAPMYHRRPSLPVAPVLSPAGSVQDRVNSPPARPPPPIEGVSNTPSYPALSQYARPRRAAAPPPPLPQPRLPSVASCAQPLLRAPKRGAQPSAAQQDMAGAPLWGATGQEVPLRPYPGNHGGVADATFPRLHGIKERAAVTAGLVTPHISPAHHGQTPHSGWKAEAAPRAHAPAPARNPQMAVEHRREASWSRRVQGWFGGQ